MQQNIITICVLKLILREKTSILLIMVLNLRHLGPKIWDVVPQNIEEPNSLSKFKSLTKFWKPDTCPWVLGQFSPRKIAPRTFTPWMIAPRIIAPGQFPHRIIAPEKDCPQIIAPGLFLPENYPKDNSPLTISFDLFKKL